MDRFYKRLTEILAESADSPHANWEDKCRGCANPPTGLDGAKHNGNTYSVGVIKQ